MSTPPPPTAFFHTQSREPTAGQKTALLVQIQALPGGAEYDRTRLTSWFRKMRAKMAPKETASSATEADIRE